MKHTIKVSDAEKITVQATQEQMITVAFEILNEKGEVVAKQNHGFPLDTSKEEIDAAIAKALETHELDEARLEVVRANDEANIKADQTINQLKKESNKSADEKAEAEVSADNISL